jgi:hypothetical protein
VKTPQDRLRAEFHFREESPKKQNFEEKLRERQSRDRKKLPRKYGNEKNGEDVFLTRWYE